MGTIFSKLAKSNIKEQKLMYMMACIPEKENYTLKDLNLTIVKADNVINKSQILH